MRIYIILLLHLWLLGYAIAVQPPEVIFYEDFESPTTPTAYSEGTSPDNGQWVRANQGFGATRHGINDKAGGDFSAVDPNQQAYSFRYSNSGLTTQSNVIHSIALDTTYTISFDVVRDIAATPYSFKLYAASAGVARNDCRNNTGFTVLKTKTGNAPADGSFATVNVEYVSTNAAVEGMDLTIRFVGATTSANIDNVQVTWLPPDPAGTVFTIR